MIIARNVPLDQQLSFMNANIRSSLPEEGIGGLSTGDSVTSGWVSFRNLLRSMYSYPSSLSGKDDDDKHDSLIATLNLLYSCFLVGVVSRDDGRPSLRVDKALLSKAYRRGGVSKKAEWLATHGVDISWFTRDGKRTEMRTATTAALTYPSNDSFVPAVKLHVDAIESTGADPRLRGRKLMCTKQHLFAKADVEAAFTHNGLERDEIDPKREDIVATAGRFGPDWLSLVELLELGLRSSGFYYYEPGPAWVITFFARGRTSFLIVNLGFEAPMVELTLPAVGSERAIRERQGFSPRIRERIEKLGCSNCADECKGRRISEIDGVSLCQKNSYNRRIYVQLASKEDFMTIGTIARLVHAS